VKSNLRIVIGVTGGIAAYKIPSLVRIFRKKGAEVKVVCTNNALALVAEQSLRIVSGNTVYTDGPVRKVDMDHISLAKWGDFLLVCPATANTIAKIACGIADNLLSTLALSFGQRMIIAPAMNTAMWINPATQANIDALKSRGIHLLPVDEGDLACGEEGLGRLLPLETIAEFAMSVGTPKILKNKKVLIASGPTREPVDAVRFISNRSSGKMGAALARAAWLAGAHVTLISGPSAVMYPAGIKVIKAETAEDMLLSMKKEFEICNICIMAAAVSDFRAVEISEGKIHRENGTFHSIELSANPDIAAALGEMKRDQFHVCFSLEKGIDEKRAYEKMQRKNCDMIIMNSADKSLESDTSSVKILFRDKSEPVEMDIQAKDVIARRIMEIIAGRMP
jgi:phosphopantothenoylcysteine decarboxylase / phosphopantothenate---cysteine ligase